MYSVTSVPQSMVRERFCECKEIIQIHGVVDTVMWKLELSLIISRSDKVVYWQYERGEIKEKYFSKQGSKKK